VRAALRADAERSAAVRRRATECASRERARCDAARRGSFFNALSAARARRLCVARSVVRLLARRAAGRFEAVDLRGEDLRADVDFLDDAAFLEDVDFLVADLRVGLALREDAVFRFGDALFFEADFFFEAERLSGISTPARRASDNPIAIAWRAFFAPCAPSRIRSISRFTNSPAWVLADLPARLSARARWMVALSGIATPLRRTESHDLQ
jgi:hypothetical protein